MKKLLLALMFVGSAAHANPYFRFEPFKEISNGAFFKLGDPKDNVAIGQKTSLIRHHEEDGHLLIPGVTWNLLDLGWAVPVDGNISHAFGEIGPSVNLSEPIKGVLRLIPVLNVGFMKSVLASGNDNWALNAGPGFGIQMSDKMHEISGRFNIHVGLGCKWGGPDK